jgi:formylglycine-generating enzyme required for sulfatase activity
MTSCRHCQSPINPSAKYCAACGSEQSASAIHDLLRELGLEIYIPTFDANAISDDLLPDLSDHDLAEIGVRPVGHRKTLLKFAPSILSRRTLHALSSQPAHGAASCPALPNLHLQWCPHGAFLMGSPTSEAGRAENESQVSVTLPNGFFLAHTTVTEAQWKHLMGDDPERNNGDSLPAVMVSWNDANEFCRRLTQSALEKRLIPDRWSFTLPTEAQWEYACRAGTASALNNGTNLSSEKGSCISLDSLGWYDSNSSRKLHPVAQKAPNAWGIHDMHGNVWEWTADWYADSLGATPPDSGVYITIRGGSLLASPAACRSAVRGKGAIGNRFDDLGFRLALVTA